MTLELWEAGVLPLSAGKTAVGVEGPPDGTPLGEMDTRGWDAGGENPGGNQTDDAIV